jgi:hypothetical protein
MLQCVSVLWHHDNVTMCICSVTSWQCYNVYLYCDIMTMLQCVSVLWHHGVMWVQLGISIVASWYIICISVFCYQCKLNCPLAKRGQYQKAHLVFYFVTKTLMKWPKKYFWANALDRSIRYTTTVLYNNTNQQHWCYSHHMKMKLNSVVSSLHMTTVMSSYDVTMTTAMSVKLWWCFFPYLESVCWTQSRPFASPTLDTVNWNALVLESRAGRLMTYTTTKETMLILWSTTKSHFMCLRHVHISCLLLH